VPSDGGFLVQKISRPELIMRVYETGKLPRACEDPHRSQLQRVKINGIDEDSASMDPLGRGASYWVNEAEPSPAASRSSARSSCNSRS